MANGDAAGYVAYRARKSWDLVIAGRGPAGLAVAIVAAAQGIYVLVLERRDFPLDKACGEGLLPLGVRALERLGVTPVLDRADVRGFTGIRFIQEDGSATESPFPDHSGLGSRRTALVEAATRRADVLGAVIRHRPAVSGFESIASGPIIRTGERPGIVAAPGRSRRTSFSAAPRRWPRRSSELPPRNERSVMPPAA